MAERSICARHTAICQQFIGLSLPFSLLFRRRKETPIYLQELRPEILNDSSATMTPYNLKVFICSAASSHSVIAGTRGPGGTAAPRRNIPAIPEARASQRERVRDAHEESLVDEEPDLA